VKPFGKYAARAESFLLNEAVRIFVNGHIFEYPKDLPISEKQTKIFHNQGNVNLYPFDKVRIVYHFSYHLLSLVASSAATKFMKLKLCNIAYSKFHYICSRMEELFAWN
jgi:hypothetical protein